MIAISAEQLVWAPFASAAHLLPWYVAAHAHVPEGRRVDLYARGLRRTACLIVTPAPRPYDGGPCYSVSARSENMNGPPLFDAIVSVQIAHGYDAFWLLLTGTSEPLSGPGGIAELTAQEFLADIAGAIETRITTREHRCLPGAASAHVS
jgi:hypothetical protein